MIIRLDDPTEVSEETAKLHASLIQSQLPPSLESIDAKGFEFDPIDEKYWDTLKIHLSRKSSTFFGQFGKPPISILTYFVGFAKSDIKQVISDMKLFTEGISLLIADLADSVVGINYDSHDNRNFFTDNFTTIDDTEAFDNIPILSMITSLGSFELAISITSCEVHNYSHLSFFGFGSPTIFNNTMRQKLFNLYEHPTLFLTQKVEEVLGKEMELSNKERCLINDILFKLPFEDYVEIDRMKNEEKSTPTGEPVEQWWAAELLRRVTKLQNQKVSE